MAQLIACVAFEIIELIHGGSICDQFLGRKLDSPTSAKSFFQPLMLLTGTVRFSHAVLPSVIDQPRIKVFLFK